MKREGIPFDGFGSVVEMLRRADGAFREKILANIRRRDPELALRLERNLGPAREASGGGDRGHRATYARSYGQ